jgi:hypothetical protein
MSTGNKKLTIEEKTDAVCRATIFSAEEASYGADYKKHLFEQYRMYVESVNYTSELKLKINTYFLTVNTALFTAIGLSLSRPNIDSSVWHFMLPLAGILISFVWWGVTYSYKQRNIAKLKIIHCLEERLPLALYKTEWQLMNEAHNGSFKKYFFRIDLFIPFVFAISYLIFVLVV